MKNLIKIPRNYSLNFCWQNTDTPETTTYKPVNNPIEKRKTDTEIQKQGKTIHYQSEIIRMQEHILDGKERPKDFYEIPVSLFLKLSAEKLRTLFIDKSGTIDFRGNLKVKREIGLTDLFPKISKEQQFVVIDGENYAYGARRHDGKIGYGNPKYKAITGGEQINFFISSGEKLNKSFVSKSDNNSETISPDYEKLSTDFAGFNLENLTPEQEIETKEKFLKETEHVEEVEAKYRELIDFPADIPAISNEQIDSAAQKLGINPAIIKAIISVESKNAGNTSFESHIYKKYQYSPLNLDEKGLTQMATSFGSFQIMGFNYKEAGFSNVNAMVNAMKTPEGQINAFVNFVQNNSGIHTALKNQNWQKFAELYNGPDYAKNDYDTKISNEYHRILNN